MTMRPALRFVDDGHPEATDYADNYVVVGRPVAAGAGAWSWLGALWRNWCPSRNGRSRVA